MSTKATKTENLKVPGEDNKDVDNDIIQMIADGSVDDMIDSVADLSDDELAALLAAEKMGKARTTALGAIAREQQRRQIDANHDDAPGIEPSGADSTSYADMNSSEIDPATLASPVLTKNGWLLPTPRAEGQG